jgi:hypothetical protein
MSRRTCLFGLRAYCPGRLLTWQVRLGSIFCPLACPRLPVGRGMTEEVAGEEVGVEGKRVENEST